MSTQILPQTCTKVRGVFTKRLMKTLSVTITSVVLLIGFGGNSFADAVGQFAVSMKKSGNETYSSASGYITHTAEVTTNRVFAEVDWYVDGVWQTTTKGDGVKKTASFTKGFSGHGPGKHYWILAEADSEDGRIASDSHIISVYKNVVAYDGGERDGLGYVEIAKCEWIGNIAHAEMSASVHNDTGREIIATMTFRYWVQRMDKDLENELDIDGKVEQHIVKNGGYVCDYFNKSFMPKGKIPAGIDIKLGVQVTCSAAGGTWTASHSTTTELVMFS